MASVNGSLPPSGNAIASSPTGSSVKNAHASPGTATRMRCSRTYAPIAWAPPPSAANRAATGLASAVSTASTTAIPLRLRWSANAIPIAGSRPNANVSRPVNRLVAVAAPNHSAPSHASSPKWRRTSGSNSAAVPTAAIPPATCGVSTAAIGGNSTL